MVPQMEVIAGRRNCIPTDVGGAGAHSIYIMVVVRAIDSDEIDDTTPASINDADFLAQSEVKVAHVS